MSNVSKTILENEPPKAKKLKNQIHNVVSTNNPNFLNSMLAMMDQNMNNVPSPPTLKSLGKMHTTQKKEKKVPKAIVTQSERSGSKVVSWRKPLTEVRVYKPL
ncbi:unnamed protein product [Auanema sp. JU1783]|nr:unnamed protein product [Auanema sp. JU1783]